MATSTAVSVKAQRANDQLHALLTATAFLLAILAAHPFVEMGVNDDWSYIRTAQLMAHTGHFMYVGWAVEPLGWQILLGALFIKVLGFSFTAARLSTILIAVWCAYLTHRLMHRLGITEWNATFGTLVVVLSPVFLPLAPSFMTDVPGFFAILVCLYCCIRALQARSVRASLGWLAFAAVSNILLGTVRQISWLGILVMVPATGWLLRKSKPLLPVAIGLWLMGVAAIFSFLRWFAMQPYSLPEKIGGEPTGLHALAKAGGTQVLLALTLALLALPVTAMFPVVDLKLKAAGWFRRLAVSLTLTATAAAAILAVSLYLRARLGHLPEHFLMPWLGNTITIRGSWDNEMVGTHPVVLNVWVRALVSVVTIFCTCSCICILIDLIRTQRRKIIFASIPTTPLLILLGSFLTAYGVLLLPRATFHVVYDRYLIPPLLIVIILLLLVYQSNFAPRGRVIGAVAMMSYGLFAIALSHDFYALGRARVEAASTLQKAGIARTNIEGGFEFDAWTQLEQWGYINQPDIVNPPGAFHRPARYTFTSCKAVFTRFPEEVPAVDPRYVLAYDQTCFKPSNFAPLAYRTWLPPYDQKVYIQQVP